MLVVLTPHQVVNGLKDLETLLKAKAPPERILRLLTQFNAGVWPTEELLRTTKAGIAINRLKATKTPPSAS